MPPMNQLLPVAGLLLALGACTALPPAKTPALGIPFNEEAKQGYVHLAGAQWDRGDLGDFLHFHDKATSAMIGDVVPPDRVASRELAPEVRAEALQHRRRLVNLLEAEGRVAAPVDAGAAQVNFDCWLEEAEARPHLADTSGCGQAFLAALDQIEAGLPPPAPFVVLFPRAGADLTDEAIAVVRAAVRTAQRFEPTRVDVIGYADPAGPPSFNMQISQARARAVADQLVSAGIPARLLNVEGRGGARLSPIRRENRRVEIALAR